LAGQRSGHRHGATDRIRADELYREIFDINFANHDSRHLRMVSKTRGRIVNIMTVGVNLAVPFGGLLNSSKCAFAS
jgi:hypothetical protein